MKDSLMPTAATPTSTRKSGDTLSLPGLEAVYDRLATAIDQAGPDKATLFLVKLALLNAHALGDELLFGHHVEDALRDL